MTNIFFKDESNKVSLDEMLDFLSMKCSDHTKRKVTISARPGRKYIKLVSESSGSRYVYCFLDYDGNILKAASWKAPAKGVRGHVCDDEYSWNKGLSPYGAAYLR